MPKLFMLRWCHALRKVSVFFISLLICVNCSNGHVVFIINKKIKYVYPPVLDCYSQSFTAYSSHLLSSLGLPAWCTYAFCQPYTVINVLASNHTTELINTSTSISHSTLDRWTIENKCRNLNICQTHLNARSKFIGNKCPGFYSDKYGFCL